MSSDYNEKKNRILFVKTLSKIGSLSFTVFWAFIWMIGMVWTFWTIGKSYRKFYQFPSTITEKKIFQEGRKSDDTFRHFQFSCNSKLFRNIMYPPVVMIRIVHWFGTPIVLKDMNTFSFEENFFAEIIKFPFSISKKPKENNQILKSWFLQPGFPHKYLITCHIFSP